KQEEGGKRSAPDAGSKPLSQADRWGSIEADDDENNGLAGPPSTRGNASKKGANIQIRMEPEPKEFVAQLHEFIEYQNKYGTGWVTGTKLRIKECGASRKRGSSHKKRSKLKRKFK
ncbi:hypothetical protein HDU76_011926, partial [Blyttiomyces sp. JEL0837]